MVFNQICVIDNRNKVSNGRAIGVDKIKFSVDKRCYLIYGRLMLKKVKNILCG
jgi:hypothetical protein